MARIKRNSGVKKPRSKLRSQGDDDTGIEGLDQAPRPAARSPRSTLSVTKDSCLKNFWHVTLQLGKISGCTSLTSDTKPDKKHPCVAKLLLQMKNSP